MALDFVEDEDIGNQNGLFVCFLLLIRIESKNMYFDRFKVVVELGKEWH